MVFSVIIPARNEEAHIGMCIDSIRDATWDRAGFEILVIDNGSIDRTGTIAREKGAKVFEQPDVTVSALRNLGAGMAKGKILAFIDADCVVDPTWFKAASRYVDQPEVVCFGAPPVIPERATWVQETWFQVRKKEHGPSETDWLESMNMFVRKDAFFLVGGFNEDLITCEDYDLSLRLGQKGRLIADQRIVAVHHGEAATLAHFFRKERWRGTSNLHGLLSHGLQWKELPSLLLPPGYLLLAALTLGYGVLLSLFSATISLPVLAGMVLLWQGPLVLLALWKSRGRPNAGLTARLLVLFNVYFLARGSAMLRLGQTK